MEPDELSLLDAEEEDENGFFSTTPTLSSQESLIDSLLSSSIKQSAQYTPVRRSALSKSTSGQDTFSKIKRLKRTSSVKNNNNNLVVPIQPALRSSYDGLPDTINYFEDEFKFPSLENPTYRINFESTDESNSEVELGMTDIDSDFLSEGCFTEFQTDNRPKYLRTPKIKFQKNLSSGCLQASSKEWSSYCLWVKQVAKSSLCEKDVYGHSPSLRQIIFLHFFRLEIPTIDIIAKNVGTDVDWKKRSRVPFTNVASYIQVPLDDNFNATWWCSDSPIPDGSNGFSYICHIRQTYLEERKKSKRERRIETKLNFSKSLINNEIITVFESQDPKQTKERNNHINWAIKWIVSPRKKIPHKLRTSCSRLLVSLIYPVERYEGLINKLWESDAVYPILRYARKGEIVIHKSVEIEEIKLGHLLDRGSTGKVYFGIYNGDDVAVKISSASNVSFKIEDFRFEVALMCLLRHSNIAFCVAANVVGPKYALVSSLQSKGSLRSVLLNKEEISWKIRIQMLCNIARGMEYLHKNRIIHRDLKTPNIIVGSDWSVQITDFGSSCILGSQSTDKGVLIGTTEWMAPEVMEGGNYNEKVDVYSFGIIIFEVIAREIPFIEKKSWQIPDFVLAKFRPEIPNDCPYKALKDLTTSCWNHSPRKRPSFTLVKEKLENLYSKMIKDEESASNGININFSDDRGMVKGKGHNSSSKLPTETIKAKYRTRSISGPKKLNSNV